MIEFKTNVKTNYGALLTDKKKNRRSGDIEGFYTEYTVRRNSKEVSNKNRSKRQSY